jgi:hypothetical protein
MQHRYSRSDEVPDEAAYEGADSWDTVADSSADNRTNASTICAELQ